MIKFLFNIINVSILLYILFILHFLFKNYNVFIYVLKKSYKFIIFIFIYIIFWIINIKYGFNI
jgi:hypothetical protein